MAFRKSVPLNCPIMIVTSQALQKVGTERAEKISLQTTAENLQRWCRRDVVVHSKHGQQQSSVTNSRQLCTTCKFILIYPIAFRVKFDAAPAF